MSPDGAIIGELRPTSLPGFASTDCTSKEASRLSERQLSERGAHSSTMHHLPRAILLLLPILTCGLQPPPAPWQSHPRNERASSLVDHYASKLGANCTLTPRVACHRGIWNEPPAHTPTAAVVDGPLLGNGDLGAVFTVGGAGDAFLFYLGKSDLWATNLVVDNPAPGSNLLPTFEFYQMLGAGLLAFGPGGSRLAPAGQFSAAQHLQNATVAVQLGNATVSALIAPNENTLLIDFAYAGEQPMEWNLSLIMQAAYGLPMATGVDRGAPGQQPVIYASKTGVRTTENSMVTMPCDSRSFVIWPSTNVFAVDGATGRLRLANGSTIPVCPRQVAPPSKLSIGECDSTPATDWRVVPAPPGSPSGALQLQQYGVSPLLCAWTTGPQYYISAGVITIGSCAEQTGAWWFWDEARGQLHYNATHCLAAVPPNVNVTVGLAFTMLHADGTAVVLESSRVSPQGDTAISSTATAIFSPNSRYTFVLTAFTQRDTQSSVTDDPVVAAVAAARSYVNASGAQTALRASHAAFWADYWSASALYLGEQRQLLEGFWYGMQYLLGSTARAGKVGPGLWGVWNVLDTAEWNGDYTVDYNVQANYYGACSSNHCDLLKPYFALMSSDWVQEASRQRAAANWLAPGSGTIGGPGQVSMSMSCGPMVRPYDIPALCSNSTPGEYAGIEMVTHLGPFPGMCFYTDLSLRANALFAALPYIVYAESMGDAKFLREEAFVFLEAVADFFISYVTPNGTGSGHLDIMYSCAQEICGNGIPVEHNPHHDIAMLQAVLKALIRWTPQLGGRATAKEPTWSALLAGLAPYPTGNYQGASVWIEAEHTETVFPSQATSYPVVYTAALHPAEVVSLSSDSALRDAAWNTISVLAASNAWRPGNGLCMAWPPATRVAGPGRAAAVLSGWEAALQATMFPNFWPNLGGGGIEQAGATEAINSALLQSQEGFLRFFPMWPVVGEDASFSSLRARGSFLVSASFDGTRGMVISPITVVADGINATGTFRNCSFLNPFLSLQPTVTLQPSNTSVTVVGAGGGLFSFVAATGLTYALWG